MKRCRSFWIPDGTESRKGSKCFIFIWISQSYPFLSSFLESFPRWPILPPNNIIYRAYHVKAYIIVRSPSRCPLFWSKFAAFLGSVWRNMRLPLSHIKRMIALRGILQHNKRLLKENQQFKKKYIYIYIYIYKNSNKNLIEYWGRNI
jgi:hypothetical protein